MRGKIIQYNGADGTGTIVADGRQYRFELMAWRGDNAPGVNKTVEVTLEGDAVTAVGPVGEDVLLKEKAAEWGGKFSSALKQGATAARNAAPASSNGGAGAGAGAQAMPTTINIPGLDLIRARYGTVIPIAWFLFLLGTLAFASVTMSLGFMGGRSWTMFDLSSLMSQAGGGGGFVKFLLIVGYLSIALPLVWRNRLAWLTLLVPLIAVLWGTVDVLHTADQMTGGVANEVSDAFHIGFGFWLSLIMAIILAALAFLRFLKGS